MTQANTTQTSPPDSPKSRRVPIVQEPHPVEPPQKWGHYTDTILEGLQNQPVALFMRDGMTINGALVGYSRYWFTINTKEGPALVNKAAVVTLRLGVRC